MNHEPVFIIIGTGRSGTRYCSDILSQQGVRTAHEQRYHPVRRGSIRGFAGEASWLALPRIERGGYQGRVIHVVREPAACVTSMLRIGKFHTRSPWAEFAERHCPEAYTTADPFERACRFWVAWNDRCRRVATRGTFQLEDVTVSDLLAAAGYKGNGAAVTVPPDTNHHAQAKVEWERLAWSDLPAYARVAAQGYGYTAARSRMIAASATKET